MQSDMTQGKVLPCLLRFCLPMIGAQILSMVLVTVDAFVAGRYIGKDALGAICLCHSILFCVWGIFWGLAAGYGVVIGQYYGAKNEPMVRRTVTHGMMLILSVALFLTVVSLPCLRWLLTITHTPEALMDYCVDYTWVLCAGLVVAECFEIEIAILRAFGDARTQLLLAAAGVCVNLGLDLLFVLVFHWGVTGAALATILSQLAQVLVCLPILTRSYPILHFSRTDWSINWGMIKRILMQGLPMAMNYLIIGFGIMAVQAAVNSCGADAVNAVAVGSRVVSYAWMPYSVMGAALSTFVAQNYGAGKYDRIFECMRTCVLFELVCWIVGAVVLWFLGQWLAGLFIKADDSAAIMPMAVYYLRVGVLGMIFLITLLLFRHTMQGLGHASVSLMGGIVQMILRCTCSFVLARFWGFEGVCFVEMVAWAGESIVTSTAFVRWKHRYDNGLEAGFDGTIKS